MSFLTKPRKPLAKSGFKQKIGKPLKRTAWRVKPKVKKIKTKRQKVCKPKTLKTKIWTIISKYIRKKYADHNGYVQTVDGAYVPWQETHCGHLFHNSERSASFGGNELWYYENNYAPQTMEGNYFNKDESGHKYMIWAIKRYGLEEVEKMQQMKRTPKKFSREMLEAIYEEYKRKFEAL